ncbi:MAG: DUF4164 domain-containing protein [Rhizobiaceae bacterium]
MTGETTLREAMARLNEAIEALESSPSPGVSSRSRIIPKAEAEVQRLNADRSRLAQELDTSEARAERLEEANKEVSRRLVTAMETIRAVLDR